MSDIPLPIFGEYISTGLSYPDFIREREAICHMMGKKKDPRVIEDISDKEIPKGTFVNKNNIIKKLESISTMEDLAQYIKELKDN